MREWEDLSNWFIRLVLQTNTIRLPLLSNNSNQELKKKTVCVPFKLLHFGCQMHQTALARRKAILPWAPLKEVCQQSCSMQAFSNIKTGFAEKITLKWIYLYTKMRYYVDSCDELSHKCLLQSAFNHCNWESELRKLWHVWDNMERWTYFCQAADKSHKCLFIFRDQQWHHNLVRDTQVYWEPRAFNCSAGGNVATLQEVYELRSHTLGATYTSRGSNVYQKHLDLKASYSLEEKYKALMHAKDHYACLQ